MRTSAGATKGHSIRVASIYRASASKRSSGNEIKITTKAQRGKALPIRKEEGNTKRDEKIQRKKYVENNATIHRNINLLE